MTIAEYEAYMAIVHDIEARIGNNDKYPIIKDNKIKKYCKLTLELSKVFIRYILYTDAIKKEV